MTLQATIQAAGKPLVSGDYYGLFSFFFVFFIIFALTTYVDILWRRTTGRAYYFAASMTGIFFSAALALTAFQPLLQFFAIPLAQVLLTLGPLSTQEVWGVAIVTILLLLAILIALGVYIRKLLTREDWLPHR